MYFASTGMLDRVLRGGDWERVKYEINFKTTKQTTRQIDFSDAFKTKIGSFRGQAAIIRKWAFLYSCTAMSLQRITFLFPTVEAFFKNYE